MKDDKSLIPKRAEKSKKMVGGENPKPKHQINRNVDHKQWSKTKMSQSIKTWEGKR